MKANITIPKGTGSIHSVSMARRFIFILIFEVVVVVVVIFYGKSVGNVITPFKEGGLLTGFSFIQLLVISGYSWGIFRLHEVSFNLRIFKTRHVAWLLIAFGFLFLAFDEVFEIHEKTDILIHELLNIGETGFTDRLDDVIIFIYALLGMSIIYHYRDGMKKYVLTLPYVKWAFTFLYIMILLDIITNRRDIVFFMINDTGLASSVHLWLSISEDAFKVIAEGAIFAVVFRCSQIVYTDPFIETYTAIDLFKAIKKTHHRLGRYGQSYGIVICDIDGFNAYVDEYGNYRGNELLKTVSDKINNSLRYSDDVFRRSSREILVIAHNQDQEGTANTAEKLRSNIESLQIEHKESENGVVTISCGVAAYDKAQGEGNWKAVLNLADNALNKARSSGRNRVCVPGDKGTINMGS